MKKLVIIFSFLLSSVIYSNPIIIAPIFSELSFNSQGWIIEIADSYNISDSVLSSWRITSGGDTAYPKLNLHKNEWGLYVITQDSVTGILNINPEGDTIYFSYYRLAFGGNEDNPPLLPGQSLCYYRNSSYFDYSATIGLPNDSVDATGSVFGRVTDAEGKAVAKTKVVYDYHGDAISIPDAYVFTDSAGNYFIPSILAKKSWIYVQHDSIIWKHSYVEVTVRPSCIYHADIKLDWIVSDIREKNIIPGYLLSQNYPNPFNPKTTINFSIPSDQYVEIKIFDGLGKEIKTLLNDFVYSGEHKLQFDGSEYASGTYFYRLKAGNYIETKKLVLVK